MVFTKRKIVFSLTLSFLTILSGSLALAQSGRVGLRTITTAVPFLMIGPDSRSGAMGDAGAAIADNANAMYWNTSNLAFTQKKMGYSLSYTPWLRYLVPDINLAYLAGYHNLGEKGGVFGYSLDYFSLGEIIFTDESAIETGKFNASEFALTAGYTRKVTKNLSAGLNLKYIYSNLAGARQLGGLTTKPGQSVAGDVSVTYNSDFTAKGKKGDIPINFKWGTSISNIGAKMAYTNSSQRDFIPINLRTGYAFKFGLDEYNTFSFTQDFNKLLVPSAGGSTQVSLLNGMFGSFGDATGFYNEDSTKEFSGFQEEIMEISIATGLEYWYNNLFAIRAGYFYENKYKGNRKYFTFGAGLRYRTFGLDFAYLAPTGQNHPLQNTLRFTLVFDFDSKMVNE